LQSKTFDAKLSKISLSIKSKDYDCGGETVGVAIEAVRTLKSPSESERFTIPTKQKSRSLGSAFLFAKFDSSLKGNVVFAVVYFS
jgi:hypothetical protein